MGSDSRVAEKEEMKAVKKMKISVLAFLAGLAIGWGFRQGRENLTSFLEENFITIVIAIVVLALLKINWKIEASGGILLGFGIGFSL